MKKFLSLILAVVMMATMAISFSACKKKTDWENIQKKGKFVCGITLYEPMNYKDENDELVGFDTELAKLVAEKLGVEVEFQVIDWGNKYIELNTNNIDCIWNGFTSNTKDDDGVARADKVDFSYAYLDNAQCVVIKSSNSESIKTAADLAGKTGTAETGSAGATYAKSVTSKELVGKTSQMDTFTEVKSGAVDFAVVDVLLAENIVGEGNFSDLMIVETIDIDKEVYSIGCRKNSDFDEKINEALIELLNEGKIEELAVKYNVHITDSLMAMKNK
jgi:polar amino acid transport system substrate-binding protein